ncbi:hypothetical protein [Massilia glaciei]|uniref:DUF4175 domain-containing protein n=1 Tax=Massilia glaciei TaxID=1524097 RepID=A0A2U2HJ60_9BURK|nr:hypothetical protein [Massilia glaciei]PWF47591.1 hypothetical protein C7C56_014680 [Massilia glaciei]
MRAATDDALHRLRKAALARRGPLWVGVVLLWSLLATYTGVAICMVWVLWDAWRLDARVRREWTRWLDGALPELEDSSALLEHASSPVARLQRQRLLQRVAGAVTDQQARRIVRERVRLPFFALVLSLICALGFYGWQQRAPVVAANAPAAKAAPAPAAKASEVVLRVAPPKYTGVAAFESAPRDLQVPVQSVLEWCLKQPRAAAVDIELSDGKSLKVGSACARWSAMESVFWRLRGERLKVIVTPDHAPVISVSAPRDMVQVLAADAKGANIALEVRDDYRVSKATMHLTLARGSGENIRFSDREMPLPAATDARLRRFAKQWTLAELGMEPGDELYFFVRASDNATPPHLAQSPTYTLRLPGPVEVETETSAMPMLVKPENLRSQRQIIIDTEQLLADINAKRGISAATVRARSESIASDQGQLRRRYGQFLGEESNLFGGDDHDHDHEEDKKPMDVVAEYGHAHDQADSATMFDEATKKVLRRALSAMWDAEKALRAITPRPALGPEYKALAAIKELQQADRIYLHKTAFTPPAIKEEIRMTGDVVGAKSYRREQGGADEVVAAEVRTLMAALATEAALPALWNRTAQDLIRARIGDDARRLDAQRAVQDVADGCIDCRQVLRAWLRGALADAPVLLQATPVTETSFTQAWRKGSKP